MPLGVLLVVVLAAGRSPPAAVEAGRVAPLYGLGTGQRDLPVRPFRIDRRQVTQAELAAFLEAHPQWQRGQVPVGLTDGHYLQSLEDGLRPRAGFEAAPAVHVTWFLAEAFCEAAGGRLPTTLEWEYVAAADETRRDASKDPAFVARILAWYALPSRPDDLTAAGSRPNVWGVERMHLLVWEWTLDFNGVFFTGDSRQGGDAVKAVFCGGGAAGAARPEDYAAFMRYALRNSLTARHALGNLGFRCAYERKEKAR